MVTGKVDSLEILLPEPRSITGDLTPELVTGAVPLIMCHSKSTNIR
jgi:hypothetical protein